MANQKQLKILKEGVKVWNQWRSSHQSARIDLSSSDLQQNDLRGANLYKANLRGANLNEANLRNADLGGANLRGADVNKADISGGDFTGANLVRSSFRESFLTETDFTGANLTDANLYKANLSKANFCLANLSYANLNETNLNKANFAESNFHGATIKGVDLSDLALSPAQKFQIEESRGRVDVSYSSLPNRIQDASDNAQKRATPKPIKDETQKKVFFTAYHPIKGKTKDWHTLLVYAHTSSLLAKVRRDVEKFNDQIKFPKETTSQSFTKITQGAELVIIPSCEGVTFNPERVSFKWMEDLHRIDFRFKADKSLSDDAARGQIAIYWGPVIIGSLKFAMVFNDKETKLVEHEERAKMYGKDDVFISYSRKDSEVARTFKTVLEGTGLDVFLDVDNIRSGQYWENELKRRIERAQIFQIFWSSNYSQSINCKQEWEYALKQSRGEGYIRPVFWKKPLSPKPPEELNKFNFKYVELNTSKDGQG